MILSYTLILGLPVSQWKQLTTSQISSAYNI